jgi:hypothetical protein
VTYTRLIKNLADDTIIRALSKTVQKIANDVGVTDKLENADKQIIVDGVTIVVAPHIHYYKKDTGKEVDIYLHTDGLTLKADNDIKDVLTISDVAVSSISQIPSKAVTYSDRVGEYSFARVPYDFAKLGDTGKSLLRLYGERYDYFPSGYEVLPAFEKQESSYTVLHHVLNLKPRKEYNLALTLKTTDGASASGATVTLTGIKDKEGGSKTYTVSNSSLTISGVLQGLQNLIVSKDGYVPVVKTINIGGTTTTISQTVTLRKADKPADYRPFITVDEPQVDYEKQIVIITGSVDDRSDGTISDTLKLSVQVNGLPQSARVSLNSEESTYLVSFTPPAGISEIEIVATNNKGTTRSAMVYVEYYPDYGNLKGTVTGIGDTDAFIASLYDEAGNLYDMSVADEKGEFYFLNVPVGDYTLSGTCFDVAGNIYYTDSVSVTVKPGTIVTADQLSVDKQTTTVDGAPVIEFILDGLKTEGDDVIVNASDTSITIKASVNNFDLDNDVSSRFALFVNDMLKEVEKSNFVSSDGNASSHNYTFTYTLDVSDLYEGTNTIYIVAVNKNYEYDFSDDLYIIKEEQTSDKKTVSLEFVRNSNTVDDDYFYLDLYDNYGIPVMHKLSEYNGTHNYLEMKLKAGTYGVDIYCQNNNYLEIMGVMEVKADGSVYLRGQKLTDSDSDGYLEVNVQPVEITSSIPPFIEPLDTYVTVEEGETETATVLVLDFDDNAKLTVQSQNASIAVVNATTDDEFQYELNVTGKSEGETSIILTATDDAGNTVNSTIYVEVLASSSSSGDSSATQDNSTVDYPPNPDSGEIESPPNPGQ